jgi:hypothetical protein
VGRKKRKKKRPLKPSKSIKKGQEPSRSFDHWLKDDLRKTLILTGIILGLELLIYFAG